MTTTTDLLREIAQHIREEAEILRESHGHFPARDPATMEPEVREVYDRELRYAASLLALADQMERAETPIPSDALVKDVLGPDPKTHWWQMGMDYAYWVATDPAGGEDWATGDVVRAFEAGAKLACRLGPNGSTPNPAPEVTRDAEKWKREAEALWLCVAECVDALRDGVVNIPKLRAALDNVQEPKP